MRKLGFIAFVGLFLAASEAQAQQLELRQPAARQGYYVGGGLRSTNAYGRGDNVGGLGLQFGFGFSFRTGQMVNDYLGVGLYLNAGGGGSSDWGFGGGGLGIEMMYKPLDDYDFAVRGGIGFAAGGLSRREEELARDDDPSGGIGANYTLGVSYDLFPFYEKDKYESGGFAFTGFFEVNLLPADEFWIITSVTGLEITYWFGLDDNKLDLPADRVFQVDD